LDDAVALEIFDARGVTAASFNLGEVKSGLQKFRNCRFMAPEAQRFGRQLVE
jgi:hypothetical protein